MMMKSSCTCDANESINEASFIENLNGHFVEFEVLVIAFLAIGISCVALTHEGAPKV